MEPEKRGSGLHISFHNLLLKGKRTNLLSNFSVSSTYLNIKTIGFLLLGLTADTFKICYISGLYVRDHTPERRMCVHVFL